MADWAAIRVQTEPDKLKYVSQKLSAYTTDYIGKYYFQKLQQVAALAADVGRNYIEYSPSVRTPTGEARGAKGRVLTGEMRDNFKASVVSIQARTKYSVTLGWLDGRPGYAIFQELGTSNGIKAMGAVRFTAEFFRLEMQLSGSTGNFPGNPPRQFIKDAE